MAEIDDLKTENARLTSHIKNMSEDGSSYRELQRHGDEVCKQLEAEKLAHAATKDTHAKAIADLREQHAAALKAEQDGRKADKLQLDAQLKAVADKAAANVELIKFESEVATQAAIAKVHQDAAAAAIAAKRAELLAKAQ